MTSKRRLHSGAFKAKVALEAMKGEQTLNEIAQSCQIHPVQVAQWKKILQEGAPKLFEREGKKSDQEHQAKEDEFLRELGRLQMEVNFLKKKLKIFP
jgi:transposase-like protein